MESSNGGSRPDARRRRASHARLTGTLHFVDRRRTYAALLMVAATVLLCLAVEGAWWQTTVIAYNPDSGVQANNIKVQYDLGGYIACSTYKWNPPSFPCGNVSARLHGGLALAYEVGNYAVLVLAEVGAVLSALLWVGNTGLNLGRRQLKFVLYLLLGFVISSGILLGGTALAGPGAEAAHFCYAYSGNQTTCPFFWGSATAGGVVGECAYGCFYLLNWGAGTSYYETLAATGLAALALFLLWLGRQGPYSLAEMAVWAAQNRPLSLSGLGSTRATVPEALPASRVIDFTQAPTQISVYPKEVTREAWRCPRCGRVNSPWAPHCGHCRQARPPS